jgi:hypothetical protein
VTSKFEIQFGSVDSAEETPSYISNLEVKLCCGEGSARGTECENSWMLDISFTKTKVTVIGPDRAYYKETSLQQTLSAILGLIIATSGCPHTEFFKPMAKFHLPFATQEETLFRTFGAWLIGQYFQKKEGGKFDEDLAELNKRYEAISEMNVGLIERVRSFTKGDANRNAILVLHCFSSQVQNEISENLGELKAYFPHLKDNA